MIRGPKSTRPLWEGEAEQDAALRRNPRWWLMNGIAIGYFIGVLILIFW